MLRFFGWGLSSFSSIETSANRLQVSAYLLSQVYQGVVMRCCFRPESLTSSFHTTSPKQLSIGVWFPMQECLSEWDCSRCWGQCSILCCSLFPRCAFAWHIGVKAPCNSQPSGLLSSAERLLWVSRWHTYLGSTLELPKTPVVFSWYKIVKHSLTCSLTGAKCRRLLGTSLSCLPLTFLGFQ